MLFRRQLGLMSVGGVIDEELERRASLECLDFLRAKLETHEVHGRGLVLTGPVEILVGDAGDPIPVGIPVAAEAVGAESS